MAPYRSNWPTVLVYQGLGHIRVGQGLSLSSRQCSRHVPGNGVNPQHHSKTVSRECGGGRHSGRPGRQKERRWGQSLPGTLVAFAYVLIFQKSAHQFFFLNFIYIIHGLLWYIKPHVIPKEYFDIANKVVHFDEIQSRPKAKEFEMPCSSLWESPICPI